MPIFRSRRSGLGAIGTVDVPAVDPALLPFADPADSAARVVLT